MISDGELIGFAIGMGILTTPIAANVGIYLCSLMDKDVIKYNEYGIGKLPKPLRLCFEYGLRFTKNHYEK
ncbi:MAG: hypothetical protein HY517_04835 [Candidatus Aenigmarchaeota archaeon]|nr:hypothetical protein [Candidatus Aenigmarchaeota archaeon]